MINRKDSKTMDLNLENAIPIKVLKDELLGLRAEYQCDMGGMYAMQKIRAIENILGWFGTPDYKRRLGHSGFNEESNPTKIENMDLSVRSYNCLKEWQTKCRELLKEKQIIKSEAIKDFAERLKEYELCMFCSFPNNKSLGSEQYIVLSDSIDDLVKEMTEEIETNQRKEDEGK